MLPSKPFHELTLCLVALAHRQDWKSVIKEAKSLHFEALVLLDEDLEEYRVCFNIIISQAYLELGNAAAHNEKFRCYVESLRYALKAVGVGTYCFKESNMLASVACDALYQAHLAGTVIPPNEYGDCKELGYIKSSLQYVGENLKRMGAHHKQIAK
jgi:hypothetical protein